MKKIIMSQPNSLENAIPPMTKDQFFTLVDALDLEDNATIDQVIAKVLDLVENKNTSNNEADSKAIAASSGVTLSFADHADLKAKAEAGQQAMATLSRMQAETTVDEAIRRGKILAAQKDIWVQDFLTSPEATKQTLSAIPDGRIPIAELGRGGSDEVREGKSPTGWVC